MALEMATVDVHGGEKSILRVDLSGDWTGNEPLDELIRRIDEDEPAAVLIEATECRGPVAFKGIAAAVLFAIASWDDQRPCHIVVAAQEAMLEPARVHVESASRLGYSESDVRRVRGIKYCTSESAGLELIAKDLAEPAS